MRVLAERGSQFLIDWEDGKGSVLSVESAPTLFQAHSIEAILLRGYWNVRESDPAPVLNLVRRILLEGKRLTDEETGEASGVMALPEVQMSPSDLVGRPSFRPWIVEPSTSSAWLVAVSLQGGTFSYAPSVTLSSADQPSPRRRPAGNREAILTP
jgi:hypothetical protein